MQAIAKMKCADGGFFCYVKNVRIVHTYVFMNIPEYSGILAVDWKTAICVYTLPRHLDFYAKYIIIYTFQRRTAKWKIDPFIGPRGPKQQRTIERN